MVATPPVTRTLTTSEAAVLALLGLGGAGSGYELTKRVGRAIGHVGLRPAASSTPSSRGSSRTGSSRANRSAGDAARQAGVHPHPGRPGRARRVARRRRRRRARVPPAPLRRLADADQTLALHVERFREATQARLDEYRAIEPINTREGADRFHWFELRRAIERAEQDVAWADWVLAELAQ